jgi:hypothetical protein
MNAISKWTMALTVLSGTAYGAQPPEAVSNSAAPSLHIVQTNLPGVYAFTKPPADFDARSASPEELAAWGYPPRPDVREGSKALERWKEQVNPVMQRSVPDLVRREGVYHRPVMGLKVTSELSGVKEIAADSSNWSGIAVLPATGGQPFYLVTGRWIVPAVKQAPGTCSGSWDYSSQWVGIGGFSDSFLFQSGSAANVFCDIGNNITEYFPWIEWLPNSEIVLYKTAATETLYPFAAGDYVIVSVWAPTTSWSGGASTTGNLSFADVTQGWSISLVTTAAALGGSKVTGQSAEWIVERTEVNGALATLPDYVADPWWSVAAEDLGSVYHYAGSPGTATQYNITMLDNNNAAVSFVDTFGAESLWFFPEGSAVK